MPSFQHRSPAKGTGAATGDAGNNLIGTGDAQLARTRLFFAAIGNRASAGFRSLLSGSSATGTLRPARCLGSSSLLDEAYSLGAFGCIYTQDIDALGKVCGADAVALGVAAKHAVD